MKEETRGIRAIIVTAVLAAAYSAFALQSLDSDAVGPLGGIMIVLFIYAKFGLAMFFTMGWKVFNRKTFFGMPRLLFVFYTAFAIILISGYVMSERLVARGFSESSARNMLAFLIPASAGILGTFCMWYMGFGEWMGKGNEYDSRVKFKSRGDSDETIEQKIAELKGLDII